MNRGLLGNLVGGEFVQASGRGTIDVVDPATAGEVVGSVPAMSAADLAAVFDAAAEGARAWRATGHLARGRILLDAAALIRADASALADLIVAEMGKTRAEATGEVGKAAEFFEYYGALARLPFGELLPDSRGDTFASQIREPLGIVLLITPWNDPLLTPARKLAPALAGGNAVVIKPATEAPLITLKLAAILDAAGLPAGVLGTVTGRGSELGDLLIADPRIKAVSFTGSTAVGIGLQKSLAGRSLRLQTEMGGKNAAVVLDDANLDFAVSTIVAGAFAQAGQRCTSTSRLIVQAGVADEVRSRVGEAVSAIAIGPGDADTTTMGPVVSMAARADIRGRVDAAMTEGAEVIARSPLSAEQESVGAFVEPLLLSVDRGNSVWRDEVFGPVLAMVVIDTIEEAIEAVNDSSYGLSSAVFTGSLDSAFRFIDEVDTGQVAVNLPTSGWDVHEPFGGFKDSGSPFKEQGLDALRFYTRVKTVAVRTR
jgi:aldehyde dehydrogenase (NAD+)